MEIINKNRIMKKLFLFSGFLIMMMMPALKLSAGTTPSISLIGIKITISTHAYWDGATQSCMPRPHGWCLHIQIDAPSTVPEGIIQGEVSSPSSGGLSLSFNTKSGIDAATFTKYFADGKFFLDGGATMSEELAKRLGVSPKCVIPEGTYSYMISADTVTVIFKGLK
jgi:hypothetical protein